LQKKHFLVTVIGEVYDWDYDEVFGAHELQQLIYDLIPYTQEYRYLWPKDEPSIFVEVDEEMIGGEMKYNYQIIFLTKVHPDNINIKRFLHRILQDYNGNELDGIDGNYMYKIKQINFPTYMHHYRNEWPFINWATNPLDVEERVVKPNEKSGITKERVIEIARNLGIENIEERFGGGGD